MQYYSIEKEGWDKNLSNLILSHRIFAAIDNGSGQDYEIIAEADIERISYNNPKPVTPLKSFFLPVKENVTLDKSQEKPVIIIGPPNCDIESLHILDIIYLDSDFTDMNYWSKRENTLLISSDCSRALENCHCTSCGLKPYPERIADIGVLLIGSTLIFRSISQKGSLFLGQINGIEPGTGNIAQETIENIHLNTESSLRKLNSSLPGYSESGELMSLPFQNIWDKYSSRCVSCGACSAICPTCSCFLLIERQGFEKVKQMDSCQYPGFERVAGGEDALFDLRTRFRNRYMCKYVWKPAKFGALACTGCGRCIEACLGRISKNEIFTELSGLQNA